MYRGKNYLTKTSDGLEINSKLYLETLEKLPYNNTDELEADGYVEVCGDNTTNYEDKRRCDQDMNWQLFMRKNPQGRGYNYAVYVRLHNGGDIRCNYTPAGIYKTNENCFQYMVQLLDAWHLLRFNRNLEYHKDEIEEIKRELAPIKK